MTLHVVLYQENIIKRYSLEQDNNTTYQNNTIINDSNSDGFFPSDIVYHLNHGVVEKYKKLSQLIDL